MFVVKWPSAIWLPWFSTTLFYVLHILNIPAFLYMTTCRLAYKNKLFFWSFCLSRRASASSRIPEWKLATLIVVFWWRLCYSRLLIPRLSRFRPKNKKDFAWDPSVQKSIKIVRQPEQLLELYGVLFREMKVKKQGQLTPQRFCKEQNTLNVTKTLFLDGRSFILGFSLLNWGTWNLSTRKARDEWGGGESEVKDGTFVS